MIDTHQTASPGVQPVEARPVAVESDVAQRARAQRSQRVLAGRLASRMRAGARGRRHDAREAPARNPSNPTTYDSLGAFVSEDPRRELRNERELGGFWLGDGFPAAAWRAAWLPRTGELYMQRIGGVRPGGRVTVVGDFADESVLGELLAGWDDIVGTSGSVHWLLERLGIDHSHLPATAGAGEA
jgi:hypothetical protein